MSKEFFEKIKELAMTQQYDEEVVYKLFNISIVSKILADQESNGDVAKTLHNISIVGESLAKKLYTKDK